MGGKTSTQNVRKLSAGLVSRWRQVLGNASLYGVTHPVTKEAVKACFLDFQKALDEREQMHIAIKEDAALLEGRHIDPRNRLNHVLLACLHNLGVDSITLFKGLSRREFESLTGIIASYRHGPKEEDAFVQELTEAGVAHIDVRKVAFQEVLEDEVVVSKEDVGRDDESDEATIQGILAFLKGDVASPDSRSSEALADIANDAQKLAELIMQAAELRQQSGGGGAGTTLTDLVVGCLRRAGQALVDSPATETQKQRKQFKKSLLLLEREILDRLYVMSGNMTAEDEDAVGGAVDEITEDVEVSGLADEYARSLALMATKEKRVVRFIKRKGLAGVAETDLRERLAEGGVSVDGWQQLLVKGSGGKGSDTGDGGGPGIGDSRLVMLLASMVEAIDRAGQSLHDDINESVAEIRREVDELAERTEEKIGQLKEGEVGGDKEGGKKPLSRRKLLKALAEIAQELGQPLTVIDCAVDMIGSKRLGELNDAQADMLELAANSVRRLEKLMTTLTQISGLPEGLKPDTVVIDDLYT